MFKEANTTRDIRERKPNIRTKDNGSACGGQAGKDVRRSMTVKLQKELAERMRSRDNGSVTESPPETQAVDQVEENALNLAGAVRERVEDGISSAIINSKQHFHEKQPRRHIGESAGQPTAAAEDAAQPTIRERSEHSTSRTERPEPKTREVKQTHTAAERIPPSPQERMRHMTVKGRQDAIKERSTAPKELMTPASASYPDHSPGAALPSPTPQEQIHREIIRDRQTAPKERPATEPVNHPGHSPETTQAPPTPREQMRQKIVRERQSAPKQRPSPAPVSYPDRSPEPTPPPPTPREQMRCEVIKERQTAPKQRLSPAPVRYRDHTPEATQTPPTPWEQLRREVINTRRATLKEYRPPVAHAAPASVPIIEEKGVSLENQSINPIKERPRRANKPKGKPAGGASVPKARGSAAPAASITRKAPATGKATAQQTIAQAKQRVQRNAQRKLFRQSRRAARKTAELSQKAAAVLARAVSSAFGTVAGLVGGTVIIPAVMLIILVAAILASPFGVLFSNEPTPGAVPLNVAVGQLNMELSNTLESLQDGDYDSIDIQGIDPDWREVVAVFAAKTAGAADGVDVAALTPDRVDRLRAVFWDMCDVSSEVEEIDHPGAGDGEGWTERILHITITAKSADDMRTVYALTDYQNKALTELLAELSTMELLLTDLTAQTEQARELLKNLPDDLDPQRRAVLENACQLVGKVSYFWGAKSLVLGWDSRWGTIQRVWADGSSTTGTYRPYGLDCSGFVDWAIYNASGGSYIIGHGGGATMQHNYCTPISWADALPGDLVFYPEDSHVGIVGGRDADGNLLIVHCASSYNGVVITGANGFTSIGRPLYYTTHRIYPRSLQTEVGGDFLTAKYVSP